MGCALNEKRPGVTMWPVTPGRFSLVWSTEPTYFLCVKPGTGRSQLETRLYVFLPSTLLQSQSLNRQLSQPCLPDGAEYAVLCSFTTPTSISIENNTSSKIPQFVRNGRIQKICVLANGIIAGYAREKYIASIHLCLRVTSQRGLCPENKVHRFDVVYIRSSLENAENFLNWSYPPYGA